MLRRVNGDRRSVPRCTAIAKHTQLPCRQPAMANGKCRFHGGKTPKGDNWHRPLWPEASAPNATAKLNRKLNDLDRRAADKKRRKARMTAEERLAHDAWQKSHAPGAAGARAALRRERETAAEVRELLDQLGSPGTARPRTADMDALDAAISQLQAAVAIGAAQDEDDDRGVFG